MINSVSHTLKITGNGIIGRSIRVFLDDKEITEYISTVRCTLHDTRGPKVGIGIKPNDKGLYSSELIELIEKTFENPEIYDFGPEIRCNLLLGDLEFSEPILATCLVYPDEESKAHWASFIRNSAQDFLDKQNG